MKHAARILGLAMTAALAAIVLLAAVGQPALAQDGPTISKPSILVRAWTISSYHKNYDVWSWVPGIKFQVKGPIASGDQLYVEFYQAGSAKPWVSLDCETRETKAGSWWGMEWCGAQNIPEEKGITSAAPVSFAIKLRNELSGTNSTLFTGKAKLAKVPSGDAGPRSANNSDFYVDQDWRLPIGYVYLAHGHGVPDGFPPVLYALMWFKGDAATGIMEGHLFYNGKEVTKDTCSSKAEIETSHLTNMKWESVVCEFTRVYTEQPPRLNAPVHELTKNPGEYEIKVLEKGHLSRAMKFTIREDGTPDDSIAVANNLGVKRAIVPVQVIGTLDGVWDKTAWKTGAFYGNPLTGFTAPP